MDPKNQDDINTKQASKVATNPEEPSHSAEKPKIEKTRKDLQLGRRMVHLGMGLFIAVTYSLLVTHQQAVYILGTCACLLYLIEQVRINYPEFAQNFIKVTKFFLRAEEQLKESSAIPYAMALLLTILTFPKLISVCAILTLAIADPVSAIVGISWGKRHIVKEKTLEGSIAFFLCSMGCILIPFLYNLPPGQEGKVWGMSFLAAFMVSGFEMLPVKLDDNLTIPLFTAFLLLILSGLFGFMPFL